VSFFFAARWFAPDVAALLPLQSLSDPLRYTFRVDFIASLFAWFVGLCGEKKSWLRRWAFGRSTDRVLGALFGVLRGLILLLAATVVIQHDGWR
jgi:membrane protein required for colicin V production